jgi:hypothetical protein
MWYDEAFAALFSARGPAEMLRGTLDVEAGVAADVHPILYYTLLWGWQSAVGQAPGIVRALSVIFGLGTVAVGFGLARALFGARTAAVAGILLALSPFQVHYSQEARMYALLALLLTSATWLYWRALTRDAPWEWAGFAILAAAAMYTHNLAFTFLLPLSLTPVFQRRWRMVGKTVVAGLAALLLYLPWLLHLPTQLARVRAAYWVEAPGPATMVRTLLAYVSGLPVPDRALPIALAAAVLTFFIGAWLLLGRASQARQGRAQAIWIAYLAVAPPLVMLAASILQPVYLDRALLPSGVMFLLWIGWAIAERGSGRLYRLTAAISLAVAFALGLVGFYLYRAFPYAPFDRLVASLRAGVRPGEVILHSNKITAIPGSYYDPTLAQRYLSDPPGSGSDTLALATQEVLGLIADPDAERAAGEANGVWFVIFPREIEEYRELGFAHHPALAWLEDEFALDSLEPFGDLAVYHFVRQGPNAP